MKDIRKCKFLVLLLYRSDDCEEQNTVVESLSFDFIDLLKIQILFYAA